MNKEQLEESEQNISAEVAQRAMHQQAEPLDENVLTIRRQAEDAKAAINNKADAILEDNREKHQNVMAGLSVASQIDKASWAPNSGKSSQVRQILEAGNTDGVVGYGQIKRSTDKAGEVCCLNGVDISSPRGSIANRVNHTGGGRTMA